MIFYKRLSELTMEETVALWNKGFEGYFVNIELSMEKFLARSVGEGLSLEHSLAAYEEGHPHPVGIVMNGFRVLEGKKVAWNGGTGIAPDYRGKGIGKLLMERNLQLYREQGVDIALLEAILQNERAIKLYQSIGYRVTENLVGMQHTGILDAGQLQPTFPHRYAMTRGLPPEVRNLPFYRYFSAWQTQWASMKDGESLIISDGNEAVGYALFKRVFGEDGGLATIALYQCEAMPGRTDTAEILKAALREVYAPSALSIKRLAVNIRASNKELIDLLSGLGFASYVEQVHMELVVQI
ncbi:GNAT family N-acetyltransferase [Cohnella endophytica]|uniref:GNAT family N-acetyltransferase n=1 Tax=Cohnella endophytica TaxID=2419778 RepID=A0A494XPG7_9BACL|nr:GNAT family N-acetyltransferase [Cohnella endophytica]RKP49954.1 GNAT family N-acetyltransferase [Cohnella endophytica]